VNAFDITAILIAVAAAAAYLNHRLLKLPASSGILVVVLVSSLALVLFDAAFAEQHLQNALAGFLSQIDFNAALMHGMLSFLLFAGALHVDLDGLIENRWTIASLSTVGVLVSAAVIGGLSWWVFRLLGIELPFSVCLVFGALISPTDPIAVMGLLKELKAPRRLASQIAGESLFNDGMGVVLFFALMSLTGLGAEMTGAPHVGAGLSGLATFFAREVAGGVGVGLTLGYVAYRALKSVDEHSLELLITLALVMFTYSLSFWIHVSGPIAVVVAGLLIGNPGRRFAMSDNTREHIDAFWQMIDGILNAVLFLLIGMEVFAVPSGWRPLAAGAIVIPVALVGRFVSLTAPVAAMKLRGRLVRGIVPILTWGGLRGGISVAMALSLPPLAGRDVLLACTYAIVVFSILVQGLTMRRLLSYYGVGRTGET
jgi:Na+:H+ antiporter